MPVVAARLRSVLGNLDRGARDVAYTADIPVDAVHRRVHPPDGGYAFGSNPPYGLRARGTTLLIFDA